MSVKALFHVFDLAVNGRPQEIELSFEYSGLVRVFGGAGGASICFSPVPMSSCDLGEYGRQGIFDVSHESSFNDVVGSELKSVAVVKSFAMDAPVGVVFSFLNGSSVSVINLGDELFIFDQLSADLIFSEGLSFVSLDVRGGEGLQ